MPLASVEGQILEALRDRFRPILTMLEPGEVEMRDNYWSDSLPHRGLSIHPLTEQYADGTIGTHDVGYVVACSFCSQKTQDAVYSGDGPAQWKEIVRRNVVDRRLATLSSSVPQHVVRLAPGSSKVPKEFPNWECTQLILWCWTRELPSPISE